MTAIALTIDVTRPDQLPAAVTTTTEQLGPIGAAYYGPGAADPTARAKPILESTASDVSEAVRTFVHPAIDAAAAPCCSSPASAPSSPCPA